MYRTTLRSASRPALRSLRAGQVSSRAAPRRFNSTSSPAEKPRSWKSSALRWGLAAGALYYYNTSPVFAEEPSVRTITPPRAFDDSDLPTVDSVIEQKRKEISSRLERRQLEDSKKTQQAQNPSAESKAPSETTEPATPSETPSQATGAPEGSPEALEEEAGQQGAFNPETGEINWDCPCLGGMAHGPCGEEFKTAFSCFVYSNEEPKGMDCIEKFQGMQECFRKYPEVYGAELADEEEALAEGEASTHQGAPMNNSTEPPEAESQQMRTQPPVPAAGTVADNASAEPSETHNLPGAEKLVEDPIPTKWEDATAANKEVKTEDKKEDKE